MVEKAQLGRSYEHGEEPIGERQERQKTKNYSNRRGLLRAARPCAEGEIISDEMGIGVSGE